MAIRLSLPQSRFQVGLWQLLLWLTAVAIVCGLAQSLIHHLRILEAKDGSIRPEVVGRSLILGFMIAVAFVGLLLGPLFCFAVALVRSRRR